MLIKEGSVRVDLLGGTIDLSPINLVLPNVVTLNVATSLKAKVKIEKSDFDGIEFISTDYNIQKKYSAADFLKNKFSAAHFGPLGFLASILHHFHLRSGLKIEISSGSPPGAGLGGSSAMGVTFYAALCEYQGIALDRIRAIQTVNALEARILDSGPAGYQDYYPALFGGVLALVASEGEVEVKQLYSENLKNYLEKNLTLVYSGETRFSAINNWEVYKAFFDKKPEVRRGLSQIAELSNLAFQAILHEEFEKLLKLISLEGEERRNLFPNILSSGMKSFFDDLKKEIPSLGIKVCGAGGGGCFLLTHGEKDRPKVEKALVARKMQKLDFKIEKPI